MLALDGGGLLARFPFDTTRVTASVRDTQIASSLHKVINPHENKELKNRSASNVFSMLDQRIVDILFPNSFN